MSTEIWKSIPGWEGYYSVSNLGSVRSERRIIIEKNTFKKYEISEKILKQTLNNNGKQYYRVSLSRNSKVKYIQVHQLVARAFLGKQENKIEVRHLDGNCRNNNLDNLCYGTKADNIKDAIKHGTFPLYEKRPGAKLNKEIVRKIRESNLSRTELSKIYKVGVGTIRQIKLGLTWK